MRSLAAAPSTPASDLLASAALTVQHRLQPFSPRYFDGSDPRLYSHAAHYAHAATAAQGARSEAQPFLSQALPGVPPELLTITPQQFLNFFRNPAQHLMGAGNDGDVYVNPKTYVASFYQNTDTAKTYYKKLNEEFQKGIIEPETFTENYDQYISRLSTGAVLGMFDQYWDFRYTAENVLKSDKKSNRTYVSVPIANPGVKDGYLDAPNGIIPGINGIGITKKCKNPERLLEFFDWMLRRDVQDYLQWGVEGKDYKKSGKNDKVLTPARREITRDTAKQRDLTGNTLWTYCPKWQGLYADGSPCGPLDSAAEYKASQSEYDIGFLTALKINYPAQLLSPPVKRAAYYPVWAMPIADGSPAKVANTALNDVTRKYYPRLIMAKPAEYDGLWEKFLDDFKASNPGPYLDEVNKLIKERMSK